MNSKKAELDALESDIHDEEVFDPGKLEMNLFKYSKHSNLIRNKSGIIKSETVIWNKLVGHEKLKCKDYDI